MEVKTIMRKNQLQSEWQLLKDNLQAINEQRKQSPFLSERVNRLTMFLCLIPLVLALLLYNALGSYLDIKVFLVGALCLSYPCVLLMGRRVQDIGISKFYLYGVYLFFVLYLGYVYIIERQNLLAFTQRLEPLNIFSMIALCVLEIKRFARQSNRYGPPTGSGIIIWGTRLGVDGLFQIYGKYDERTFDFDKEYSYWQMFKDALNFKEVTSQYQFTKVNFIPFNIYAFWLYFGWSSRVPSDVKLVLAVIAIILFVPTLSLIVRRLRDLNYSLFWLPLLFIPVISTYFWLILWWHSNKPIKIISRL